MSQELSQILNFILVCERSVLKCFEREEAAGVLMHISDSQVCNGVAGDSVKTLSP